jgi:hypothetical protein
MKTLLTSVLLASGAIASTSGGIRCVVEEFNRDVVVCKSAPGVKQKHTIKKSDIMDKNFAIGQTIFVPLQNTSKKGRRN